MPKIVITHGVVDVDAWLKFKSERADAIGGMEAPMSWTTSRTTEAMPSPSAAMWRMRRQSWRPSPSPPPELAAAMERHGVLPPLTAYVEK